MRRAKKSPGAQTPGLEGDRGRKLVDSHPNDARLEGQADPPEFGNSRRRFLIAMFMAGFVPPERVVERVVAELEQEAGP